jgi:hypothetical protein
MSTITTHTNQNGVPYYSTTNDNGETIYSFTTDFEDIWSQEDEESHAAKMKNGALAKFAPIFDLPLGEDPVINDDGDVVFDRAQWIGGSFPTPELATEAGIEHARANNLVFLGVC